jgi:thiosulfate/3-mercaptopyruvate sulfurtransferase
MRVIKNIFIYTALLIMPLLASAEQKSIETENNRRDESLISAEELKKLIDSNKSNLVIIAVAKKSEFYLKGHIPGSIRVWREQYTGDEPEGRYDGMLVNPNEFEKFARDLGVNNDSEVIVYDYKYDSTRLWWAFYFYGKKDVKILNGGIQAWEDAGFETDHTTDNDDIAKGNFTPQITNEMIAHLEDVKVEDPEIQLWDTRSKSEWDGSSLKRGAFRKGRIPHAKYLHWSEFRDPDTGKFKTNDEIKAIIDNYNIDPNKKQVFYCQSGVRTTQNIFALYLIGFPIENLKNYDGSWIEYSYSNLPLINEDDND